MNKPKVSKSGYTIRKKPLGLRIWNARGYYLMFLPVLIFGLIFYYWPMLCVRFAFFDYDEMCADPCGPCRGAAEQYKATPQ